LSATNEGSIVEFHNFLFSDGSKEKRVAKLTSELRRIEPVPNIEFDKATRIDIQHLIAYII